MERTWPSDLRDWSRFGKSRVSIWLAARVREDKRDLSMGKRKSYDIDEIESVLTLFHGGTYGNQFTDEINIYSW